jgi:hypothetical protein
MKAIRNTGKLLSTLMDSDIFNCQKQNNPSPAAPSFANAAYIMLERLRTVAGGGL